MKKGDPIDIIGGTYIDQPGTFVKKTGAFSAKIVLRGNGTEKTVRRHNIKAATPTQRIGFRNTNLYRSEDDRSDDPSVEGATATAASQPQVPREQERGTQEEDLAAVTAELYQLSLDLSLFIARLAGVQEKLAGVVARGTSQ
jgi:hypothetical protein